MPTHKKPNPTMEEATEHFLRTYLYRIHSTIARDMVNTRLTDRYKALAYAVRDEIIDKWLKTQVYYYEKNPKRVYYLSLEFLMGRTLGNALQNLDLTEIASSALASVGTKLEDMEEQEPDAGLGNGGLGRLAACFLDSMATLELPAYGYGIRYEYGMFEQRMENFQQTEAPDNWLAKGCPWELPRHEVDVEYEVKFKGSVREVKMDKGLIKYIWEPGERVIAVCYDVPIPGYKNNTVNSLKLWSARSNQEFDLTLFNASDYVGAVMDKNRSEVISKVLYPNDQNVQGKELRLMQQYFMVAASLQDILRRLDKCGDPMSELPNKAVIQLNDTHPSIAIPELMRVLIDERDFGWDEAWAITSKTFAYTNHTVLPEALERWDVPLMEHILPRHMEIIYEINQRFLDDIAGLYPGDWERRSRMSIVAEDGVKSIRMAHLAIVGSFSVNGVAALHSDLLKTGIFKDFYEAFPTKFNNKTNGVTPRRWLKHANPALSELISSKIGDGWVKHLDELKKLEKYADDPKFQKDWQAVKEQDKQKLADIIQEKCHLRVRTQGIFDVQVKRIHEYKRQLLNLLHVVHMYNRIKDGHEADIVPRTIIFAGKAAPGYKIAKDIIHLINLVGRQVNRELKAQKYMSVVFLPNYGVSLAEHIFPGSDLSEQISTAGMEASGTGNMKFALNGALTIGTLDGANVEMEEEVGSENIFIFGKTTDEIHALQRDGYNPREYYDNDADLRRILDMISSGYFNPNEPDLFKPLIDGLLGGGDPFCLLADFRAYIECQDKVSDAYRDQTKWTKMSILNVARMGKFSSDRTIEQYATEIWDVKPCPVPDLR
ncbi:MAG: glycogen/starch/alpha-glucan phosphorylase [SAR324 cluster bacterium]|nr:glycogen/starch/alpha-glucan phosphorylase [SAR324 cluster bacterium]